MLEKLVIPPNTKFDERSIVVSGDFVAGANTKIGYGIMAKRVIVGERAKIAGDVVAEEVRLDAFCSIDGDVVAKGDAYIGEFASIAGKLTVYGDLEIGRNVRIKNGFEAKGLITIQDPVPVLMFLLIYFMLLLRLGKLEDVEKLFEDVEFEDPMIVPDGTVLEIDRIETSKDVEINESKVLGNLRARNVYVVASEVFGSVRGGEIVIDRSVVHGTVEGKDVYVVNSSAVLGSIKAERVFIEEGCTVEGSIFGRKGVWVKEKVEIAREEDGDRQGEVQEDVPEPLPGAGG
ncbi:MAG: acyltransferase [Archaeoglobaceae archaeon]